MTNLTWHVKRFEANLSDEVGIQNGMKSELKSWKLRSDAPCCRGILH